jgi:ATP-dependent DNA helicase RecG
VDSLRGVRPERAAQLARLGVHTIEDLLLHAPRRYEDRRQCLPIAQLTKEQAAVTRGTVVAMGVNRFRQGTQSVFELILSDGSARLHCRWWNLPFMENYFTVGQEVFAYGKLRELKPRCMDHPETEVVVAGEEESIHLHRIAPVYPLTEGLPQRWLRGLLWRALEQYERDVTEPWPALASRLMPLLPARANAFHMLHFPETLDDAELGRRRLALDEFILLQRDIQIRRQRFESLSQALPCCGDNRFIKPFLVALGFPLTAAQMRVLRDIRQDFGGAHPMRRLLQGDVGSGKTAVAACSALMAMESGFNVALMAPTEILATQHFRNFTHWFEPLGLRVELQTGSRKTLETESRQNGETAAAPSLPLAVSPPPPALVIGTHALLTAGFKVPNLGLVIIDEQHKFGVTQRETLVRKGRYPHLLVMTATPIPRTLGLTLYGDLDISVIDELPPGRGRVRTFVRAADKLPKVWDFVRSQLAEGRQAYLVYPRVEDTAGGLTKAVLTEFARVQTALAPHRVGLLHGRLAAREKEEIMTAFRANTLQALVATSLIEVGLDVPNATIMVVENAGQFGMAQLHQLRGRIGRGAHESYCILIADAQPPEARERLRVLEETGDGFQIAEADLQLRGPGELLGQQQSGLPRFRFGDLRQDFELIRQARELAALTLDGAGPATVSNHENSMPPGAGDGAGPQNSAAVDPGRPASPAHRLRESGAES